MADPEHSTLCVLSRQEMESMGDGVIQEIFGKKHIIVKDQFQPKLGFNQEGLKTLAQLDKPVTLQGGWL
jgi:hypothetical protein